MGSNQRGDKSICLAFESEAEYAKCLEDEKRFRRQLGKMYAEHEELFPVEFGSGYNLHGFVQSKKQQVKMRRIALKKNGKVYQIRPSFLMPYMVGKTDDIDKALYLLRYEVPYHAITYAFGRNDMYWYRLHVGLGRASIVGTTIKDRKKLPLDLVADEKHTSLRGEKVYVATTAAQGCLLGASLTASASTPALTDGYGEFKQEAQELDPNYAPHTVNTDGWEATQNAWQKLFPSITIILCFLHAWIKLRDRFKRYKELLNTVGEHVWHAYHAETKAQFSQRIRRLREWTKSRFRRNSPLKEKLLALCDKAPLFKIAFDFPSAYRTSNMVDRLINYQDRLLYARQYFHGTKLSANLYLRSMALLWNFHPYSSRTRANDSNRYSPFQDLNRFRYHDNWLHNFLIAASIGGRRKRQQKPLE
jgi:hypothetical protein